MKLSIHDISPSGAVVYSEIRQVLTNKFGLFNVVIGSTGTLQQNGSLTAVNWASGSKFLQVEVDLDGGFNLVDMGTSQLQSVPHALYANSAAPIGTATGDLSGNYPNPIVSKIQGKAVSNTAPTNGQVLSWNGNSWAPSNLSIPTQIQADWSQTNNNALDFIKNKPALFSGDYNDLINKPANTASAAALNLKEDLSNKSANTALGNSDVLYPSQNAVKTYVDSRLSNASISDADANTKGKVQLAGDLSGSAAAPIVANQAISTAKIADNAITTAKIADYAIATAKIADANITEVKIADNAIATNKIANNSITSAKIADGSITDNKIASGISASKVGLGNVDNTSDLNKPISSATQNALNQKLDASKLGVAAGAASLDINGKIPSSQLPPISFTSVDVLSTEADMLALSTAVVGSTVIRTDNNKNYVLSALPATDLNNWKELLTPGAPVQSVNGQLGSVYINKTDLGLSNVDNTADMDKPVNTATLSALTAKEDISNKSLNVTIDGASDSKYPSVRAVKTYVDAIATQVVAGQLNSDWTATTGIQQILNKPTFATVATTGNYNDLTNKPIIPVTSVSGRTGNITLSKTDVGLSNVENTSDVNKPISTATQNALNLKLDANKIGVASGAASLDATGKIPSSQLPAISFTSVSVLNSQAAMTGLSSAVVGSIVIRTDNSKNYVLSSLPATDINNWKELLTPGVPVQSVNAQTGNVVITKNDIGLNNVDNTSDLNKPISNAMLSALNSKAPINNPTFTGTVSGITATMVGLGNVDNTSDLNKPVSTATQAVLNTKEDMANKSLNVSTDALSDAKYPSVKAVKNYVDTQTAGNMTGKASNVTGTVAVANGGTGTTTLTANHVLLGNGAGALQTVAPGAAGNVLTSNGTTWISGGITNVREVSDEYAAIASQTAFTLTQTPSANSKVKMYVNGIRISKNAFTVSGTTLTYVPSGNGSYALSASDRIQIDYFY